MKIGFRGCRVLPVLIALGVELHGASQRIDLDTVLRLAGAQNLSLEIAREKVREARHLYEQDRQLLFPWVAPGVGYRRHDGNLQDVAGNVFDASKQSGTAAVTLQAQLDFGDAHYRILAAQQTVRAAEADESIRQRDVLVTAASAYVELSRAEASVTVAADSLRIAVEFFRQVRQAVDAGVAFAGDAERAAVQREQNESLQLKAQEQVRLASAQLARVLRLPFTVQLEPELSEWIPLTLVSTNQSLDSMVAAAIQQRPEVRQTGARVAAARHQRDGVTKAPWIPTLGAQASLGGLAGGRNDEFHNADDFQDYGVTLSWRIGPGGIGDRRRVRTADSRLRLAELSREQTLDDITREIVEARIRAESLADQLQASARTLAAAQRLLDQTRSRREFGVGAVLEAIDAERELTRSRLAHLDLLAQHNRQQWELWRSTGTPVPPSSKAPSSPAK